MIITDSDTVYSLLVCGFISIAVAVHSRYYIRKHLAECGRKNLERAARLSEKGMFGQMLGKVVGWWPSILQSEHTSKCGSRVYIRNRDDRICDHLRCMEARASIAWRYQRAAPRAG